MAGKEFTPGIQAQLSSALVEDMQDGGMGSIRFLPSGNAARRYGGAIAEAQYIDEDGVLVIIVLNVDRDGELYEIDFWKVDFSPLKRYPRVSDITVKAVQ